ncbi:MAG: STAS domain-containing protein [Candidatus Acidiferrum sp.]
MELEIRTQNGIKVVKVKGRLCMGAPLDRFNTDMNEMLANGENKIVLDLAEMPTIDSSGIGALMRHLTAARKGGGAICLYKPTTFTLQSLKLVSLLNLFNVYDDMPNAVASLQ